MHFRVGHLEIWMNPTDFDQENGKTLLTILGFHCDDLIGSNVI